MQADESNSTFGCFENYFSFSVPALRAPAPMAK